MEASPAAVKAEIAKLEFLRGMGAHVLDLSVLPAERRRFLATVGRRLTAQALQRREPERRYPILLTPVTQSATEVLDEVVQLFDQAVSARESKAAHRMREALAERAKSRKDRQTLLDAILAVVADPAVPDEEVGGLLRGERIGWERLRSAQSTALPPLPRDHGHLAALDGSYGYLRQFTPQVLDAVAFAGGIAATDLLKAVEILRELNATSARKVPGRRAGHLRAGPLAGLPGHCGHQRVHARRRDRGVPGHDRQPQHRAGVRHRVARPGGRVRPAAPLAALEGEAGADRLAAWFTARWAGSAAATFNARLDALGSACTWWRDQDWLTGDPLRRIRRRTRIPDRTRALARIDIEVLLTSSRLGLRERTLFRLLYESAARAQEVLALDVDDLDLRNRRARVRRKGGTVDVVIWQTATARLLPRLLDGRRGGPVFLTDRRARVELPSGDLDPGSGRARLSYRRAAELFEAATAGLPGGPWTLHQLRHSALTHATEDGANTSTLLAYSGHTSVASLARYARVSPEALARWQSSRDPATRRR
ncbi:tyrosine-type recombinase/integrase [Microbispora sitophila]|uniref:tyrosine-type recombinase/integrase n=1 Tax=Microbispora sitophila TaxID=2771537 RepID=UPI00299F5A96|nr:tyrosine-type recombinase/integrase [Microbispora sitophila]